MSRPARAPQLPRTRRGAPAAPAALRLLRPARRGACVRRRYDVRVARAPSTCPAAGPVILAANHVGVLDGPLLAIFAPRPVHALTKKEMFDGPHRAASCGRSGRSRWTGTRPTRAAVKACLRVLRDGGVVGVFPEGTRGAGELRALPPRRGVPRAGHRCAGRPA